jgi:hypothetical protein
MTFGEVRGVPAWVGAAGTSPAGIFSCADNASAQGCDGLDTYLMFVPGTDQDPALAFVAPDHGTYHLTGKVVSAIGNPEGLTQRFMVSRNTRHDLIDSRVHVTAPTPDDFTADVELVAGDRLIVTFVGGATESVPVAFDYHLTLVANGAGAFPGNCEMAATFDGSDPMADPCRGSAMENLGYDTTGPGGEGPSVTPDMGKARVLGLSQYLRSPGGPLDYTGDFTVQFWARLDEPQEFQSTLYADWNVTASGGINLGPDDSMSQIFMCDFWEGATDANCASGTQPTDQQWHFFRMTRSVQEGALELCIDGRTVISDPNVGAMNMTSDQPPHIGRNVDYNPPYFAGAVDDIRAFKTALPCPTP